MPTDISEKELETILVSYLRDHQGYEEGVSSDYNKEFGLNTERVKRFILSTQKEKVENTACFTSPTEEHKFFSRLSAALSKRGVTDVLRKGFKYISEIFDMYYPTPSALNPTAQQYYDKNIFCVTRQLYYSKEKTDSIDVYISLNGLPMACFPIFSISRANTATFLVSITFCSAHTRSSICNIPNFPRNSRSGSVFS